jgi:hypothetical protein
MRDLKKKLCITNRNITLKLKEHTRNLTHPKTRLNVVFMLKITKKKLNSLNEAELRMQTSVTLGAVIYSLSP